MSVDWPDVRRALDILDLDYQGCRRVTISPRVVEAEYLALNAEGRIFADENNDIVTRTLTRQIDYPGPKERFPDEATPIHDQILKES